MICPKKKSLVATAEFETLIAPAQNFALNDAGFQSVWRTLNSPQSLWLWSPLPLSWSGWALFLRPAGTDDGACAPTDGEQHTKNPHTTSNRTPQPLSPEADPFVQDETLGDEQKVWREWSGGIQKAGWSEGWEEASQNSIQAVFLLVAFNQGKLLRWWVESVNVFKAFTPLVMSQNPGRKTKLFFSTKEIRWRTVLKHGRQLGSSSTLTPEGGRDRCSPATLCASSLSADSPFTESF